MQVRLLGPVDVAAGGVARPVPGLRRKAVLAALALHAGDVVEHRPADRHRLGRGRRATALNTLQRHVSYLRGVLGDKASVLSQPPGYRLDLGAEATDVVVAERLVEQARQPDDPARGAAGYRAALGLWRGPALADVAGLDWFGQHADRLERLRTVAVDGRCSTPGWRWARPPAWYPSWRPWPGGIRSTSRAPAADAGAVPLRPAGRRPSRPTNGCGTCSTRSSASSPAPRCASCRRRSCARPPGSTRHRHRPPPAVPAPHPRHAAAGAAAARGPRLRRAGGRARPPRRRARRATGAGLAPPRRRW